MNKSRTIKLLTYILTILACLVYALISVVFIIITLQGGDSLDPETITAMVLDDCALVLLLIGIFSKKESILVPTIVAGLGWVVANVFITDVSSLKTIETAFNKNWSYGVAMIISAFGDLFCSTAIILFFVELLKGDGISTGKKPFYFFYSYVAIMVVASVFSLLPLSEGNEDLSLFVNSLLNLLLIGTYIFVIYSFFYKKKRPQVTQTVEQIKK